MLMLFALRMLPATRAGSPGWSAGNSSLIRLKKSSSVMMKPIACGNAAGGNPGSSVRFLTTKKGEMDRVGEEEKRTAAAEKDPDRTALSIWRGISNRSEKLIDLCYCLAAKCRHSSHLARSASGSNRRFARSASGSNRRLARIARLVRAPGLHPRGRHWHFSSVIPIGLKRSLIKRSGPAY